MGIRTHEPTLEGSDVSTDEREEDRGGPDREQIFEVLSNERRRHTLQYLERYGNRTIELRELVTHVAARENDTAVERLNSAQRKRVYTALRQTHLPKLDNYDLIEYDSRRGELELTDHAREAQMHLEYVPANDIPWCYYYLGLTAILSGIAALAWLSVFPFAGLSGMAIVAVALAAFGLSAACHALQTRRNTIGTGTGADPDFDG